MRANIPEIAFTADLCAFFYLTPPSLRSPAQSPASISWRQTTGFVDSITIPAGCTIRRTGHTRSVPQRHPAEGSWGVPISITISLGIGALVTVEIGGTNLLCSVPPDLALTIAISSPVLFAVAHCLTPPSLRSAAHSIHRTQLFVVQPACM
jgi:hypothetical protein